jgi:hypothetical protein
MRRRNQAGQATLGLGRTFSADGKRRGGTPSANEDGRETIRSSWGTLRPHAGHSVGRTVRESARRASIARPNTGERVAVSDADSASRSEAAGDPGRGRYMRHRDRNFRGSVLRFGRYRQRERRHSDHRMLRLAVPRPRFRLPVHRAAGEQPDFHIDPSTKLRPSHLSPDRLCPDIRDLRGRERYGRPWRGRDDQCRGTRGGHLLLFCRFCLGDSREPTSGRRAIHTFRHWHARKLLAPHADAL